jgi:hypothetical protein
MRPLAPTRTGGLAISVYGRVDDTTRECGAPPMRGIELARQTGKLDITHRGKVGLVVDARVRVARAVPQRRLGAQA